MAVEISDSPLLLVTGGSRGIGAATALAAACAGYDVALTYVANQAAAEKVADEIRALGRRAVIIKADMGVESDIEKMFAEVDAAGGLKAVVYNSAVTGENSTLADARNETLREVVEVNLLGALMVGREAVKRLSTKHGGRGGSIVFISSRASDYGSAGEYVWYAASKGGVDSLTIGLAREVAREGVRVNAVSPGPIATDMHRPGRLEAAIERFPFGRAGTPDEVAEAVMFLLSEKASFTSGAILNVSGAA
ncbi:SDR family oxidoreductase [Hyphococcus luteus]|uniref:NAD(P)-dependent oxidoreductase n=1 Tax=Hyphococcus luteus TaxID=2058213 RepID=A0A2S7K1H5_9PROT|nr:SDR family oxidoreductase [Marinicaulis flavus]PQA86362.1 NAD(P)-dependent oxidoreductase [Marinicaulis flavus]